MNIFKRKLYTPAIEDERNSIEFAISARLLKQVDSIERVNIGRASEYTMLYIMEEDTYDVDSTPTLSYVLSRKQHNSLVDSFREFHRTISPHERT